MSKQVNVKAYPKDFKEQVVKLAQVGDRSATQVIRRFRLRSATQRPSGCRPSPIPAFACE